MMITRLKTKAFQTVPTVILMVLLLVLAATGQEALVDMANPMQGTDSVREFSHGNTYPAIAVPFPMNAWAPYTQPVPDSFYHQYRQTKLRGIRRTHQPSPWINEHAAFSFMPVTGELRVTDVERAADFSHGEEEARPSYYRIHLPVYDVAIEVTPTTPCGSFRVTYGDQAPAYLVLNAFPGGSEIRLLPEERKVAGVSRYQNGGTPENFANYFVVEFDQPLMSLGTWSADGVNQGQESQAGEHVGAYFEFDTSQNCSVTYRVASSFIIPELAQVTLDREIGDNAFEPVLAHRSK